MAEHLHAVLGAHADQELAVAAELLRAERRPAVEVADVREHLAPLAGSRLTTFTPSALPSSRAV